MSNSKQAVATLETALNIEARRGALSVPAVEVMRALHGAFSFDDLIEGLATLADEITVENREENGGASLASIQWSNLAEKLREALG